MPDKDGYPTKSELERIRNWDYRDIDGLLDFLHDIWWAPDWGFGLKGKKVRRLELHTGGWSGNEEIIGKLRATMFWMLYWQKSTRGGHFYFRIEKLKKEQG